MVNTKLVCVITENNWPLGPWQSTDYPSVILARHLWELLGAGTHEIRSINQVIYGDRGDRFTQFIESRSLSKDDCPITIEFEPTDRFIQLFTPWIINGHFQLVKKARGS